MIDYDNANPAQHRFIEERIEHDLGPNQTMLVEECLELDLREAVGIPTRADFDEAVEKITPNPDDLEIERVKDWLSDEGVCLDLYEIEDENGNENEDELRQAMRDYLEEESPEVYEWWVINHSLVAQRLQNVGELVLSNGNNYWWGRQTTQQRISLDSTWWQMFQEPVAFLADNTARSENA